MCFDHAVSHLLNPQHKLPSLRILTIEKLIKYELQLLNFSFQSSGLESLGIAVRNTTKYAILMNLMVVILNRSLGWNNQLLSDAINIYQNLMWITMNGKIVEGV
jgi:hypothetical protein